MSKTAEEILLSGRKRPVQEWTLFRKEDVLIAMHTHTQQQAVEFPDWIVDNDYKPTMVRGNWVHSSGKHFTTSELYQLFFNQQNNK